VSGPEDRLEPGARLLKPERWTPDRAGRIHLLTLTGQPPVRRGVPAWEIPGLGGAESAAGARWIDEALDHGWALGGRLRQPTRVVSLVPTGYPAYARVFHSEEEMRGEIEGGSEPGEVILEALATCLEPHTRTPGQCWFAIWDGWNDLPSFSEPGPAMLHMPARSYILITGPVGAAPLMARYHPPAIWWPEDRSWVVGGDVDLDSTFVAGDEEFIAAVLARPELLASHIAPDAVLSVFPA
jgi:hypothetical protein